MRILTVLVMTLVADPTWAADVFRCGEPKGVSMWSMEKHKAEPDGFAGVQPVVIIEGKEMRVVWGDSKAGGGEEKVWKAIIVHDSPESVSAVALDTGATGSSTMLFTVDRKRSYLYMSSHKSSVPFNGSAANSFVATCTR